MLYLEIHPTPAPTYDIGIEQLLFKKAGNYVPLPCTLDVNDSVNPALTVRNYGNRTQAIVPLRFSIVGNVIYDCLDTIFNLPAGSTETLELRHWRAVQGNYTAKGIYVPGDTNPANDTLCQQFYVRPAQGIEGKSSSEESRINQSIILRARLIEMVANQEVEVYNSAGRRVAKEAVGIGVYFIRQSLFGSEKLKKVIVLKD